MPINPSASSASTSTTTTTKTKKKNKALYLANERGATRSGARFQQRNKAYYNSEQALLKDHKRLVDKKIEITTRETKIANYSRGTLLQTVVRIHVSVTHIAATLRSLFFELFREHAEGPGFGFEVVTTFNAILCSQV